MSLFLWLNDTSTEQGAVLYGTKVKRENPGILIFIIFLLIAVIAFSVHKFIITQEKQHIFKIETDSTVSISPDKLTSPNAILVRLKDDAILMQKNSQEKIYPASLTKIMTAIVAIENLPNLNEEIELTNYTFQGLYKADASMTGFQPGENVRAIDRFIWSTTSKWCRVLYWACRSNCRFGAGIRKDDESKGGRYWYGQYPF